MVAMNYGDMARWTSSVKHTNQIKDELNDLVKEWSSGERADLAKHLGFDQTRVSDIDERLERIEAYTGVRRNMSAMATAQQAALTQINNARTTLGNKAMTAATKGDPTGAIMATREGEAVFSDMVRMLNTQFAGQALFAGSKLDSVALPDGKAILTDLKANIDFTKPAADIVADIKTYFTSSTGGYATTQYQGGTSDGMERQVSPEISVKNDTNAMDTRIRAVLAAVATIAVAGEPGGDAIRSQIVSAGGVALIGDTGFTMLQGEVGLKEEKIAQAQAEMAAVRAALTMERNERVSADKYETASKLQNVQIQLENHFRMVGRLSDLTLVKFL